MIIIKTANGVRFINEAEVKKVRHNKPAYVVTIVFKDGTHDVAHQVESMCYTNKADIEVRDNGLILGAVTTDKEYWKEMAQSAEKFVERLIERRNELENFIFQVKEHPESDTEYRERFIEKIREERNERPGYKGDELRKYRDYPYFQKVREESHLKGDEAEKQFTKLTKNLKAETEWANAYRKANERLMKRNLWQRIINKKTYLFPETEEIY